MSSRVASRQILERPGKDWGVESGTDKLVAVSTRQYRQLPTRRHAGAAAGISGLLQKLTNLMVRINAPNLTSAL